MTAKEFEIKPCPFCGSEFPWTFITAWCCVLRCQCGAGIEGAAVRTVYQEADLPDALRLHASPASCLVVNLPGGIQQEWPEHGYYSVPVTVSFHHFGHAAKWNQRAN